MMPPRHASSKSLFIPLLTDSNPPDNQGYFAAAAAAAAAECHDSGLGACATDGDERWNGGGERRLLPT